MERWPWIVLLGAGLLGYVAGQMIFTDPGVIGLLPPKQIDGIGVDPVQHHLGRFVQVVGLLLLGVRLPAVARKGKQQGNDQPRHSTVFP